MTETLIYLQHYPIALQDQVKALQAQNKLGAYIQSRYPQTHNIQSNKALFTYCNALKLQFLSHAPSIDKVVYDSKLSINHHALGLNKTIARVQGSKMKAKKEIRIASSFKHMPEAFLKMILVHELAHLKESEHNKSFYKLCEHMAPDYHQLEFDCRVYLTWKLSTTTI